MESTRSRNPGLLGFHALLASETLADYDRALLRVFLELFSAGGRPILAAFLPSPGSDENEAAAFSLVFGDHLFTFSNRAQLQKAKKWIEDYGVGSLAKRELILARSKEESSTHQIVQALSTTLLLRDRGTGTHSRRVTFYCDLLCEELGVSGSMRKEIVLAGLLHDLGKIGVSDRVLRKASALSVEEWEEMRAHTEWGYEIVRCFPALLPVAEILRHHHERFDGTGYPNQIGKEEIPFGARSIAVADAFDAMTNDRPYRKAFSFSEARDRIRAESGIQFDPEHVNAFLVRFKSFTEIEREVSPDLIRLNPRFPETKELSLP